MASLGQQVGNTRACMPFVHLRGDSFWELSYYDPNVQVSSGGEGPGAVRKKIRCAFLKEPYWTMLQDEACRNRCLDVLNEILKNNEEVVPVSGSEFLSNMVSSFSRDLGLAGLSFNAELPARLVSALGAKPFLLLTGLSGSGKTKLAQVFSKWVCAEKDQVELIAVGADWTSNENLLGYPDALKNESYRKPDNGALDLILRARQKENENCPFFLILDEMNLSHVERYFADFLSAMESEGTISLHDGGEEDLWPVKNDGEPCVPGKLKIPKNLFVIGTVNVDETTYMFSPKVLDRANVIEFRVSDDEMESFLENPVKPSLETLAGKGAKYAKSFVAVSKQEHFELKEQGQVSDVLMKFFPVLQEAGAEFGYRTAHEICRFVYFYQLLTGEKEMVQAMDAAIMQKLLPKLHGSKKKLQDVLNVLIWHCLKEAARPEKMESVVEDEKLVNENALYPVSLDKLKRMRKRLAEHGFASFAEA